MAKVTVVSLEEKSKKVRWYGSPTPPCKGNCYSVLQTHKGENYPHKTKPYPPDVPSWSCSSVALREFSLWAPRAAPAPPVHCAQLVRPLEHQGPGIFWKVAALLQVLGSFNWPLTHVHRPSTKYLQMTLPFLSDCWWGLSWSLLL